MTREELQKLYGTSCNVNKQLLINSLRAATDAAVQLTINTHNKTITIKDRQGIYTIKTR